MILRFIILLSLILPSAWAASPLVGAWTKDGAPYAELRADGTGQVDVDRVAWKANGKTITLVYADGTVEIIAYTLSGDKLTVSMDGEQATLMRAGAKASAAKVQARTEPAAAKGDLAALLLSSPWCHFRYNKVSGASHEERLLFRKDGSWSSGSRAETYSSGAYGTVSGQSDSGSGGRWQAKGERLLMGEGSGELEDVGLSVTRNSNGYPIFNAGGKEYSQCR